MRTTVEFDADTSAAIERLRRDTGMGVSEAVNALVRRGLMERPAPRSFRQHSTSLGLRIDVSNVADALEALDGATAR